jgi:hypothetical protein
MNAEHYNDFTVKGYREILQLAMEKYSFVRFDDQEEKERYILWRHDIDFSVQRALKLAKLEASLGLTCIYFVQLSSMFYNVFEKENKNIVTEIGHMGHQIGLHFDPGLYGIEMESQLFRWLTYEKKILEELLNKEIKVFSFHNPSKKIMLYENHNYAGMLNVYSRYYRENVGYCSDSNGKWRHRRLKDVLEKAEEQRLQILTHPAWWQEMPMTPKERIQRCINGRAQQTRSRYEDILRATERMEPDG